MGDGPVWEPVHRDESSGCLAMRQSVEAFSNETADAPWTPVAVPDIEAHPSLATSPQTEPIAGPGRHPQGMTLHAASFNPALAMQALEAMASSVQTFKEELRRLRERDQVHTALIRRMREQVRLAGAVQRNFLPARIPQPHGVDVHLLYNPVEPLSGDSYDAFRVDESQVAFVLADATGHGLPSAMLSAYVQRSFRGVEESGGRRRPLEPNEVLERVNRDLLDTQLADCQFVAALCAVYDEGRRTIRWARGGTPYPILVRNGEPPCQIESEGLIVGACERPRFELVELTLEPGDLLLFHTDGLDQLLVHKKDVADPHSSDGRQLNHTDWFRTLDHASLADHLQEIERQAIRLSRAGFDADDLTLLALDVRDSA